LGRGVNHFKERKMLAGYVRSKSVPLADLAVIGTGVALVAGVKPKPGAAA